MDFIDVLRFEDSAGIGPYTSPRSPYSFGYMGDYDAPGARRFRDLMRRHDGCSAHQSPYGWNEPWSKVRQESYPYCGFKDLDQLLEWFSDELIELLLTLGFQLISYRVPVGDVALGSQQTCFNKKNVIMHTVVLTSTSTK